MYRGLIRFVKLQGWWRRDVEEVSGGGGGRGVEEGMRRG